MKTTPYFANNRCNYINLQLSNYRFLQQKEICSLLKFIFCSKFLMSLIAVILYRKKRDKEMIKREMIAPMIGQY